MKSIGQLSLLSKAPDLEQVLEEERTQEFYFKVKQLTSRLPALGRCSICTMKIPCKHYQSPSDQPDPSVQIEQSDHLKSLVEGLKNPENIVKKQELPKDRSFSVRYRGSEVKFEHSENRNKSMNDGKKLKVLEKIEEYREMKIQKEIEKLKAEREEELRKMTEDKIKDEKRRRHAKELKMKIEQYRDEYLMRKEQVRVMMEEERKRVSLEEEKRKKYLDMRHNELLEYRKKKFIMDQISRKKMQDIQKEFKERTK